MNVYEVTLASRKNGEERTIRVTAKDQEQARVKIFAAEPGALLRGEPLVVELDVASPKANVPDSIRSMSNSSIIVGVAGIILPVLLPIGLIAGVWSGVSSKWEVGRVGAMLNTVVIGFWVIVLAMGSL